MSVYINIDSLEYPLYESDIRALFTNVSFETNFQPPHPFYEVFLGDVPPTDGFQSIEEEFPVLINGIWYKKFKVTQLSNDIIDGIIVEMGNRARDRRNQLLSQSDWTQVADSPVDKAAWATYRQSLRDITVQSGFPQEIQWPTPPV
jgi:hypothetical protein